MMASKPWDIFCICLLRARVGEGEERGKMGGRKLTVLLHEYILSLYGEGIQVLQQGRSSYS